MSTGFPCNMVETELQLICGDVLDALDKHLIPAATAGSSLASSAFQKTLGAQCSQVLCHFMTSITFPPVSNNVFFIAI
nr:uncharacterized protein LOC105476901 isoform X2 [Macaca nemestrina]